MITGRAKVAPGVAAALLLAACDPGRGIERPSPRFAASPVEYPLEMWNRGVEGTTVVRVLVNKGGGVDSAMIAESSGHAPLDSAAIRGARVMEFEPAVRRGEPLEVWARFPVYFAKEPGLPADRPPDRGPADTASESEAQASGGEPGQRLP